MYPTLLFFHSIFRWLVLASLLYAVYRSCKGYLYRLNLTSKDNAIRHWTATIAHLQLVIGMILYVKSPNIHYFWSNYEAARHEMDVLFFSLIHVVCMTIAVVLVTIGSAKAKRQNLDRDKYLTVLVWFSVALIFIFVAIPWPFSPFAHRPLFR